ncbi:hypothetical protein C7212DRAFT_334107, partial [Tuber magnatum]
LRKKDYVKPESYRVINLLDVWGKVLERIVGRRLEKWGKRGMGEEQFGGGEKREEQYGHGGRAV